MTGQEEYSVDLDSSATTPVSRRVLEKMLPYFREEYGNPSSPYEAGERAKMAVNQARSDVASLLGVESREIVFTSGGTESNQAAVRSALLQRPDRRTIVLSAIEHSSILGLAKEFEESGYRVRFVRPRPDGRIEAGDVEEAVKEDTALVAIMWVNNETGAIAPVGPIGEIARKRGALFHCDGVAAVGKVPVDLSAVGVTSLSLSAHKIYGPKGAGALFFRKTETFRPLIPGSQERKRRGGTENVPGIVGLGEAARESMEILASGTHPVKRLRDRLEQGILERFPGARRNVPEDDGLRAPHMTNLFFPGISGEKLLWILDKEGIRASMGSACSAGSVEPSHVLLSMGLTREEALSSLRFSLGRHVTEAQIDRTLAVLSEGAGSVGRKAS
ncbi:MAG: cysteine desulfurase [Nitrospirae bacterium]|jgi:cysteine desulfurase|nr:cysteine desulfurase [Nitrospirota bacterium]